MEMINITRDPNIPESLDSEEIRDYIDRCIAHREDPDNNPLPEATIAYRTSDLLEAFDRCFFGKCYLTEAKYTNSWVMDVDHFVPRNEDPDKVYTWTNLYPANHKANMSRPRSTPEGGYLNPCSDDDDVERDILYSVTALGEAPCFEARDPNNQKAVNTASLLNLLHNGIEGNNDSFRNTVDLRHSIQKKKIRTLEMFAEWKTAVDDQEEFERRMELRHWLSRRNSYSMLIRSISILWRYSEQLFD